MKQKKKYVENWKNRNFGTTEMAYDVSRWPQKH